MGRYFFSLIRCVPSPRTGEFINVGAVAGDPESADWSVREIGNEQRVRSMAGLEDIAAVHDLLGRIGYRIDDLTTLIGAAETEPLDLAWLERLHQDYRNVVQVSSPSLIVAKSAEAALDIIFEHYLIDPARSATQGSVTRSKAVTALLNAYRTSGLNEAYIRRGVDVVVEDHLTSRLDFSIGNGEALQLSQGWSFQVGNIESIGSQVKSWAYALKRLREGAQTQIIHNEARRDEAPSVVSALVDLEVVTLKPVTSAQEKVYAEASKVFADLGANIRGIDEVEAVGSRAAELIRDHPGQARLY